MNWPYIEDHPELEAYFWGRVVKTKTCWLWRGYITTNGYANILLGWRPDGTRMYTKAHRYCWELFHGKIPEGLQLDHLCRIRHCVNPAHLEPVTPRENVHRSLSPAALNAVKTHCKRDHLLSGDNLVTRPDGRRNCRTCMAAANRRHYERNLKKRELA